MNTEELTDDVTEAAVEGDEPTTVVVIEEPEPPTPTEVEEMSDAVTTADRIVVLAKAESEAAIIRAEADVKVHKILAPIIGAADDDDEDEPVGFDEPAPTPQSETAPRATHWYRRRISK